MKFLLAFILLASAASLFADELATTLMPPSGPVTAGARVPIDLVSLNPGGLETPFTTPASLSGRLSAGGTEWPVTLQAKSVAPVAVAPGGFAARHYEFVLPAGVTGQVVLEVTSPGLPVLRTVFEVNATAGLSPAAEAPATPLGALGSSTPVVSTLSRSFAGRFLPNQPVYFIYGTGDQSAKFQFSFDYRLATLDWGKPDKEKVSTLRFGYTQRSLWDLNSASSPFYDTSYIPEFVITTDAVIPKESSRWFTWIGWRGGFQHESNGRGGSDSRSINTVYLRPRFLLGSPDSWFLVVLPEVYTYVGGVSDNPSIKDYRGYGKLKLYFGHSSGPTLMFTGWAGNGFDHKSLQLDFTYPFQSHWLNIEAYLMAQYFDGYGESLLSYDKKSDALRFGIGLVR